MKNPLTDLEGAVLTEIGHRGNCTAFRVRRAFQLSGSANWRGSAGAVYAAIKRLTERGFITSRPIRGKRGGSELSLSPRGEDALNFWMRDAVRAADSGFDPFRVRSGLWKQLPTLERRRLFARIRGAVEREIERLRLYSEEQDAIETAEIDLAIRLQNLRLQWLDEELERT
jgi:DNA-binding PadR family transcriptional regulator